MIQPCCLTLAGSDSGGNAGVQADLRTFHAYGLHGCTVFAALTAQNPFEVSAIHAVPAAFVEAQLDAVLPHYHIQAMKTGMLAQPAVIEAVARKLSAYPKMQKVIDPVMVATSGARLITPEAIEALKTHLLPLATVITPNLPEAEVLTGMTIQTSQEAEVAAKTLAEAYHASIILKGGHFAGDAAEDLLYDCETQQVHRLSAPRIQNPISTHGTGCTFAAALTAELALGHDIVQAAEGAKKQVYAAISSAMWVGPNCGVLGFVQ